VRRSRATALIALALLNVFTIVAGVTVATMLPPRLARLQVPVAAVRAVVNATLVLPPAGTSPMTQGTATPTRTGLMTVLGRALPAADTGAGVGIEVADAATGKVLYAANAGTAVTPASTTKVLTAVAALAVLGPGTRFTTAVRLAGGTVVLAGGGDPTLAVDEYPSSDYPRPATLAALAAETARALAARGRHSVRIGYDTSLYRGPDLAPGWTESDITTGNVTPIVALEADQGRLTAGGALQDDDDPVNYRPRTTDPAGLTAAAFARLLQADGITVTGSPVPAAAPASARTLASVQSPPVVEVAQQMLQESNNVIAENLARQVALKLGLPATFSGAAKAVTTAVARLGVTAPVSLVDGSGLSPDDGIAPQALVQVLQAAVNQPRLRGALTGLPIAGFSGTLSSGNSVFGSIGGAARGVVRAKTGNLTTVATLAGLAYDRGGRLLLFAIMAPAVPGAGQLQQAADAIDSAAAALAACGCS
jgi:D-alanyl-D-alanine carboxypeptidase/D-alanyl-D-alanine-endopeptidase (penicillin-binding protein 4)